MTSHLTCPATRSSCSPGLSGSGKSSLAFDTIFAEGQRRYVESLSAYARQFLGQLDKPDVDFIEGLSPAVSIDQKSTSRNPRSTVGTITEVYDYLRLLYARAGTPHCPVCGRVIARQTPQQIVDQVMEMAEGTRFQVLAPVVRERKGEYVDLFRSLQTQGFSRVRVDGVVHGLDAPPTLKKQEKHTLEVVVDRLVVRPNAKRRLTDSVETALRLAEGVITLELVDRPEDDPDRMVTYSEHLACAYDGLSFEELEPRSFSFNSPFGACPDCSGARCPDGGRPGPGHPGPGREPGRRGHRPLDVGAGHRVLRPPAHRAGRAARLPDGHPVVAAAGRGPQGRPERELRPGARPVRQPVRAGTQLLHRLRGRAAVDRPPARRGGVRHRPGTVRGVHAGGAVPDLSRQPAQAADAGGHGGRALDRRRGGAAGR